MKEFSHPSSTTLEPVDLEMLIHTTVEISRNAWKRVAELDLELASSPLIVSGLRDELGQVLLNLIINAVDAIADAPPSEGGLGRIRILTRVAGDWAEIVVEDSGCGISPSLLSKIFEPFFTTKQVGRGSGQGLAIAYHIVTDKHGGELLVDSTPGKGSTFTVRLPL
jgi:signal transduction histidine kinase